RRARLGSNCRMARDSIVLPQPDSPTMPSVRPGASARSTLSTARSAPRGVGNSTETPSTDSSGAFTARALQLGLSHVAKYIRHPDRSEAEWRDLFLSMHRQEKVPRLRRPAGGFARDDG